jgi:hypothetical protein
MVNFSFLPCKLFKVPPELREQFQNIGLLLKWDYTDASGTYTGLAIVGEKASQQGPRTFADVTIDVERDPIPMIKVQEVSKIVQTEFAKHMISKYGQYR